jgi:cyclohexa-1,5-dienecarbonyl-CoA hydratase
MKEEEIMPDEPLEATMPEKPGEKKKSLQFIRWDDSEPAARLTLCRPKENVMNIQMLQEMAEAIDSLLNRKEVRLLILDSAPECEGYFSTGVGAEGYALPMVFQMMDAFHNVFRAMNEVSTPVLAVVDGVASGAGAELAAFCDLVIATEQAQFRQPEIRWGMFPPLGAVIYPRVIGPRRAMEFLLTGDPINAQQALMMGLVNQVVPRTALKETVGALAKRICNQSGPVLRLLKQVMFEGTWKPFSEALKNAQKIYLNQLFELQDSQEGLRALIEKRKPVWKNK